MPYTPHPNHNPFLPLHPPSCQVSDKESSITLSMYLGVKWEDSRIVNMNQTIEDLQVVGGSSATL